MDSFFMWPKVAVKAAASFFADLDPVRICDDATPSKCGEILKLHLPSQSLKSALVARVMTSGTVKTVKMTTMDNPQPSAKRPSVACVQFTD
jgi:hypothetical protein